MEAFHEQRGRGKVLLTILCLVVMSACVSKKEHLALQSRYDSLSVEKTEAEQKCQDDIADLNTENRVLFDRNTTLAAEQKSLQQANLSLQDEKSRLEEEKSRIEEEKLRIEREKDQQQQQMQQMVNRLRREVNDTKTKISMMENYLKIDIVDKLMFESGKAEVTREGRKILARIAPTLKDSTNKEIRIVGHTDDLTPSARLAKKYPSNWELSSARAAAIIHILQWGYGIAPERMVAEGVANYRPFDVESKNKKEIRKTNRVVEILLKPMPKN